MSNVKADRDHLMDAMLKAALAQDDLGEWEDERLTARSENLDWELGRANSRMAELEAEDGELRGRLGDDRPLMLGLGFRVTEEDETLLSIVAGRLHRTRSDTLRQLVRAAAADPQLEGYLTKRLASAEEENAELRGRLGDERSQMRMMNFRGTEEDKTLLSIVAGRLRRTRSDALRQLVRAAAADPQLHDYMTKRIAPAEGVGGDDISR